MKVWIHRWRCPLALGLLGAVVILVVVGAVWPVLWQLNQYQEVVEDAKNQVDRYQRIIAKKPTILAQLKDLKRIQSTQSLQFQQSTPALVAAELQELVKNMVEANEGKLISTQILNPDSTEKLPKVAIKVQVKGSLEAVEKTFYALESHQPLLFIDDVYMRVQVRQYRVRQVNTEGPPEGELDVRFDLSAYMKDNG